ncbi:MAG: hypothetical protein ACD_62C00629G0001 [uncultured bacterium]|nr:MAG: hypothetical protein ACD_62C00629G0001 [uncultured bacterium]
MTKKICLYFLFPALFLGGFVTCSPHTPVPETTKLAQSPATDSFDLENRVKRIKLDNGLVVLLLRREGAPVFSVVNRVKVGNVEEVPGAYGLAHFFEHMAFKGTPTIGTDDFTREEPVLKELYQVGTQIVRLQGEGDKPEEHASLTQKLDALQKQDEALVNQNEFVNLLQRNGGANVNAATGNDFTSYTVSLPSNKLELWAYMESERFLHPVMRDFFVEKKVVEEERRMRIDNTPQGLLVEKFLETAFVNHPYESLVIGPMKDIKAFVPAQAREFFETYYIPSRMTLALVGNFELADAERIVRQYFGRLPAKADLGVKEADAKFVPTGFPQKVVLEKEDQPRFYLGYHRPAYRDPDDAVFDFVQQTLCAGRTSRLYQRLVLNEKKAVAVGCFSSFPGIRLNTLFAFYGTPVPGHTNDDLAKEIRIEVASLAAQGPTPEEMQKINQTLDAELIYDLQASSDLASKLTFFESLMGDWHHLFEQQKRYHQVTAEDVKRVTRKYFVAEREIMAALEDRK